MENLDWYEERSSGRIGDMVYYNRWGKTYMRKRPGGYDKTATEKQALARERFIAAHQFAQAVIADPVLKALYPQKARGKCSAYSQSSFRILIGSPVGLYRLLKTAKLFGRFY